MRLNNNQILGKGGCDRSGIGFLLYLYHYFLYNCFAADVNGSWEKASPATISKTTELFENETNHTSRKNSK